MENKSLILIFSVALIGAVLLMGATITGLIVQKTEYSDICNSDDDCTAEQCCIIYEDKNIGLCMNECKSLEFLCRSDGECEQGTVCCISEWSEYGICNNPDKCQSIDIFGEYITKSKSAERANPTEESPMKIDSGKLAIVEAAIILALVAFILWRVFRENKTKK